MRLHVERHDGRRAPVLVAEPDVGGAPAGALDGAAGLFQTVEEVEADEGVGGVVRGGRAGVPVRLADLGNAAMHGNFGLQSDHGSKPSNINASTMLWQRA